MQTIFKADRHLKGPSLSKNASKLYKNSFRDMDDKTVYHDPMGFMTPGGVMKNRINGKRDMWKNYEEAGIPQKFEELHVEKNYPLRDAVSEIAKNYDTGTWEIPIFHVPEVNVVNPEQTPAADMIARVTTESDTVEVTIETDQPNVSFGLETTDNTEGSYEYDDGTYDSAEYDVVGYGLATRLEDKMILASDQIRSTQTVAEQAHANAVRQTEERQILLGTDHDADGFEGALDIGTEANTLDVSDPDNVDWKEEIRSLIDEVEFEGGDPGRIAVFVDFDTHRYLRNELDEFTRYQAPGEELGFGFRVLEFDGVPIFKSHALERADSLDDGESAPSLFAMDMDNHYMAMLQDLTVKPLAKVAPQEQFATDAYGTFVSEAPDHIQYVTLENPA